MQPKQRNRMTSCLAAATVVALAGVMFTVGTTSATAATRIVQIPQGERLFVAQNLGNVNAGDTITWNNNDAHDVVAARIPATATTFASPIMSGSTATYSQTPTVPGNYRQFCSLHSDAATANASVRGKSLSASAVINFKVPQTVQLFRAGNSVALCLIGIPEGQTESTIGVDVTIVYGGVTQPVVHKEVRIKRFTKIRE